MSKVIAITGANSGIGLAAAQILAAQGHHILALCRNEQKGKEAIQAIKAQHKQASCELWVMDLANFPQVKEVAASIVAKYPKIDVLLNNAGYYPASITHIGEVESALYASHLGHFLLTEKLLPALANASEARIINVSSAAHQMGKVARFFRKAHTASGLKAQAEAYADAKLANILFTMGLHTRLPKQVSSYSLHPGVVGTNFANNLGPFFKGLVSVIQPIFFLTPEQGAATSVYLCTAPAAALAAHKGGYFQKSKPTAANNKDLTNANAEWLWYQSEQLLKEYL